MSASLCIKCEHHVSMYEKYCDECVSRYGVKQDATFHRTHTFVDWESGRKAEFEKDLAIAGLTAPAARVITAEVAEVAVKTHKPRKRSKK